MCLAVPAKILEILSGGKARVSHQGVEREISVELVPEVKVGDFVVLHVGLALSILDEEEAREALAFLGGQS